MEHRGLTPDIILLPRSNEVERARRYSFAEEDGAKRCEACWKSGSVPMHAIACG